MLKIIRQREHVERLSYGLHFDAIDPATGKPFERGNGVGFDCDEHGAIIETDPQCLAHVRDVRAKVGTEFSEPYINTFRSHWVEPAVGRCSCGREVVLSEAPRTRWTAVRATNPASARKDVRAREGRGASWSAILPRPRPDERWAVENARRDSRRDRIPRGINLGPPS